MLIILAPNDGIYQNVKAETSLLPYGDRCSLVMSVRLMLTFTCSGKATDSLTFTPYTDVQQNERFPPSWTSRSQTNRFFFKTPCEVQLFGFCVSVCTCETEHTGNDVIILIHGRPLLLCNQHALEATMADYGLAYVWLALLGRLPERCYIPTNKFIISSYHLWFRL